MSTRVRYDNDENDDQGLFTNRSTMMANFEEWIKMATDNKINSRNSWNFALIDYFHDLNVLRDAENNINFQKASATLDGCVKIYSSRVDSVTTETGKLLSGLAQKKTSEGQGQLAGQDNDNEVADGSGNRDTSEDDIQIDPSTGLPISKYDPENTRRRIHNRILETTLVDFDTIKMKELDQELNIDPLFKKALVDFDEGGAKSLLLNTLNIDSTGRVVFDTGIKDTTKDSENSNSDTEGNEIKEGETEVEVEVEDTNNSTSDQAIEHVSRSEESYLNNEASISSIVIEDEILALGMDFIKFTDISKSVISSSMQQLPRVVEDITKAKSFIDGVNSKFDNFLSEKELEEAIPDAGLDDISNDNEALQEEISGSPKPGDTSPSCEERGDGSEDHGHMLADHDDEISPVGDENPNMGGIFEQDLMAYFDENLKKNWRGREHWKVRNFKKRNVPNGDGIEVDAQASSKNDSSTIPELSKKNKKAPLEIDFFALDDQLEETIFASKKRTNIDLPQKFRTNDSHYLLPDDFHFTTQKITRLFIKPGQTMSLFQSRQRTKSRAAPDLTTHPDSIEDAHRNDDPTAIADEQFWADNYERKEQESSAMVLEEEGDIKTGDLPNPFEEDDTGVDFNQAFEDEEFKDDGVASPPAEALGRFPFTDNKVSYSRVSKKVDVKRLKDNIWKSVKSLAQDRISESNGEAQPVNYQLKFTAIAEEIGKKYSKEAKKDISTSFCFICLLHLANEHGFEIINTDNYEDLIVVLDTQPT